jgi:hypothetical protein
MNAKDKARDLLKNMYDNGIDWEIAKECALIAVDEIIKENDMFDRTDGYVQQRIDYWNEVKAEIINLTRKINSYERISIHQIK